MSREDSLAEALARSSAREHVFMRAVDETETRWRFVLINFAGESELFIFEGSRAEAEAAFAAQRKILREILGRIYSARRRADRRSRARSCRRSTKHGRAKRQRSLRLSRPAVATH